MEYDDNRRAEILRLAPPARRVLDVGCHRGAFGAALEERGIEVWGVEPNAAAAQTAMGRLTQVVVGTFPGNAPKGETFDGIVFNDVLEHMEDPGVALLAARKLLAEGGWVMASIPNVRHLKVIGPLLLQGRWDYEDSGILDRTHLRFFTRKTIRELFEGAGFYVETLEAINMSDGIWRLFSWLGSTGRELVAYQFAVVSRVR